MALENIAYEDLVKLHNYIQRYNADKRHNSGWWITDDSHFKGNDYFFAMPLIRSGCKCNSGKLRGRPNDFKTPVHADMSDSNSVIIRHDTSEKEAFQYRRLVRYTGSVHGIGRVCQNCYSLNPRNSVICEICLIKFEEEE